MDNVSGCVLDIVAELTGIKSAPLYTFNLFSAVSNHICPRIGLSGAAVLEKFSSSLIKFSFNASPKPL